MYNYSKTGETYTVNKTKNETRPIRPIVFVILGLLTTLLLTACAGGTFSPDVATLEPTDEQVPLPSLTSTIEPTLLPNDESPPLGAEQEFSTDFSIHSVSYDEILSGGPSKDGIPAIDNPEFVKIDEANE